jgi:phage shock protein PspC (stress-responsive transcriptional regulator)
MEASDREPTEPTQPTPRPPLTRSRGDRVIGGVCAGVARHVGVDPLIVRIAAVALVFLGGLGALLYVAGLLLIPDEAGDALADTSTTRGRLWTAVGVVALVGAAGLLLGGAVLASVWLLVPVAFAALAGLFVWWLVSGQGLSGDWRDVLRRSLLGLGVLILCTAIFVGGVWAAGAGQGELAAGLVIAAGLAIAAGAFLRPVRWLVLPALSLAFGVGVASAADLDLGGGVGEREYRPAAAADLRDRYELGVGELVVDLRRTQLPRGDVPLALDVGMGRALLLVPEDVCVATRAQVAAGAVRVFDRDNGGVDLDWEDVPGAPAGTTRVVVDADVGFGALEVLHEDDGHHGRRFGRGRSGDRGDGVGNRACSAAGTAGA